jgi:hypothetical protein
MKIETFARIITVKAVQHDGSNQSCLDICKWVKDHGEWARVSCGTGPTLLGVYFLEVTIPGVHDPIIVPSGDWVMIDNEGIKVVSDTYRRINYH